MNALTSLFFVENKLIDIWTKKKKNQGIPYHLICKLLDNMVPAIHL